MPTWTFSHDISSDVARISPYFNAADVLLPMNTLFTIFSLVVSLNIVLIAFYWLNRLITLLRG